MKKILGIVALVMALFCQAAFAEFDAAGDISVVSREDGSGTRGAFVELFGVLDEDKVDNITEEAIITNSTSVVLTTVAGNPMAIGYVSLGALGDTVKALKINGAEASAENIANGSYTIARPFNIATTGDTSELASDFIAFILSQQGQQVVADSGYIPLEGAVAYEGAELEGKLAIGGSSSVTPLMEKLKEAYIAIRPNVTIEIQQSDSTSGMTAASEGILDIGMASRELKDSELEKGLVNTVIAMDGIAVVVNNECTADDLTSEQIKSIFTGEVTNWADIIK